MTSESQSTRRLREHFAGLPRRRSRDGGCPEPELIWAAVHGELAPDETGAVIDHTAACTECAEAWRLAREVSRQAGEELFEATEPSFPRKLLAVFTSRPIPLAVAAALLLLIAAPLLIFNPPGEVLRGPDSEIVSLVPENATLSRENCLLAWSAGPEGSTYRLTVATESLDPILERRDLSEARFVVPEEALSEVPSPGRILWRVEMSAPDGAQIESPTFITRVE